MQHLYMNLVLTPGNCPPTMSADYLTINENDSIQVYHHSAKHGYFNCRDNSEDTSTRIRVKWWAPLPPVAALLRNEGAAVPQAPRGGAA